jgi:hypothetical protein
MKRKLFAILVLGAALAVVPAAGAKVMLDGSGSGPVAGTRTPPAGMTAAEYRALVVRGEALNALYGNHITDLSPAQFKVAYQAGVAWAERAAAAAATHSVAESNGATGSGFDWGYAGMAAAGSMLLTLAFVAVTRRRHRLGF